jgi:tol-pal system protein YbgF
MTGPGGGAPDPEEKPGNGETEQAKLEKRLQDQGKRIQALEKRLADQQSRDQAVKTLRKQIGELQDRLHRLEGTAEVNGHELDRLSGQLKELFGRQDERLSQLETRLSRVEEQRLGEALAPGSDGSGSKPASAKGKTETEDKGDGSPSGESPDQPSAEEPPAKARYQAAFQKLKAGDYSGAAQAFREYLARFPDSRYADNAQYWLGESHYVQGQYERALEAFQEVGERFPESDKVPDALLKEGFAYYELSDYRRARQTLMSVTERFPDHRVGKFARDRLERIRQEQL